MSLLPIHIPEGYSIIVKEGDSVTQGQVVAKRSERFLEKRIPLAALLATRPKNVAKYLKKNPGDSIKEGEIIASRTSFITITDIISSVAGTVLSFDRETGDIVFELQSKTDQQTHDVIASFDGIVTSAKENVIELQAKNGGIIGIKGLGGKAEGLLFMAKTKDSSLVSGQEIVVDMIGNIVLGTHFSREALVKASGVGIAGIIAGNVDDEDIAFLDEKKMLVPLLVVDSDTLQSLAKQVGKKVYLDAIAKTVLIS